MVLINSTFIRKTQNYLHHGPPELQNAINEIHSMMTSIVKEESPSDKRKFMKADYPLPFINSVVNEF